jgi:predicted metalloendopeptidase
MSARAKREALSKLSAMSIRVGYPAQWRSYDGLEIRAADLFGNWQRSLAFENRLRLGDVAGTSTRAMWILPPQTVNAYYSGTTNEIVVPAAIVQPPVFDPGADEAVNYGAAGALVGHEIAHAFDGRGRQFDAAGTARDWWTAEDAAKFDARLRALAAQLSKYEPLPGAHVNGGLAAAETMADIAGLSIAWRAYNRSVKGEAPVIDGLTGAQRLFMGWVRIWRAKERDDYVRSQLQISAHLPPAFRAGAALANTDAFYGTFDVAPSHRLYLTPDERIRIW